MRRWRMLLVPLILGVTGCGAPKTEPDAGAKQDKEHGTTFGNTISAPVDYLDAVNKGRKTAENTLDTTSINKAIEMFQVTEGRLPKDLQELVKEGLLVEVPKDRYGRQLVYDPKTGAVRVDPKPPQQPK